MSILKLNDAEIFYQTWNCDQANAPWIYLVNGHTRSHKDFNFFAKFLTENGLNVASHDNRGSGESKKYDQITMDLLASDTLAVIDHLELESPSLLGISMGGAIAMQLAIANPNIFQDLILISTCPSPKPWMTSEKARWTTNLDDILSTLTKYFGPEFRVKNQLLIKAMAKNILDQNLHGNFSNHAENQRLALKGFDLTLELEKIRIPTLVIHGEKDEIIDVEAARYLNAHIAASKLMIYKNAGHLLIAECGKRLYQDVLEFIRHLQ